MNKDRYFFIDFFRVLAIILMFITHTYRMQITNIDSSNLLLNNIFLFFMYIEPFTSALFLFLTGYSLRISLSKSKDLKKWHSLILKKSIILILLSFLLYFPYFGVHPIEAFFSSGILMVIGISILFLSYFSNNIKNIKLFFLILLLITFLLEYFNLSIIGINNGAGGLLPMMLFSFVGYFSYDLKFNFFKNLLLLIILFIFILLDFNYIRISDYQILSINSIIPFNYKYIEGSIWIHSTLGFIINSLILYFISLIMKVKININYELLYKISNNSLNMYVIHILILSIIKFYKVGFPDSIHTLIFLIILFTLSYRFSLIFKFLNKKVKNFLASA